MMDEPGNRAGSPLNAFTPAQLFVGGIVAGILVLCTIGFLIGVRLYVKGALKIDGVTSNNAAVVPANQPTVVQPDSAAAPANVTVRPVDAKRDHIRGNVNAKVTIVEYSDTECPFCKRFHQTMLQVMSKYGQNIRWVYRHFPLDSLHRQARTEANAAECASEQGKFWEYLDVIFQETTSNDGLNLAKLPDYAKQVGINAPRFQDCLSKLKYATNVKEDGEDAQAAGAQGTPYSVVIDANGQKSVISGAQPFENVEAAIKQALAK